MPRNRFCQIWRYLHLANLETLAKCGDDTYDHLGKIRVFVDLLTTRFQENYQLSRELSIDESMVPFRGRLSLKQYMKDKPIKWGIKCWMMAEAATGYVLKSVPYTRWQEGGDPQTGLATEVVLSSLEGYEGKGHHVYCDNFYTSIPLAIKTLEDRGTYICSTIRKNYQKETF